MKPRVYGLETEYALSIETADRRLTSPDPGILFDHMENALQKRFLTLKGDSFGRGGSRSQAGIEIKEGCFLECGARFYYDTGHLEWSTPEAATPTDAALYELAGERTLAELARAIDAPRGSRLMLIKNNVDYLRGTTYGCHENYQVERRPSETADDAFFKDLIEKLIPFLVTRQIYCGAGKVGSAGGAEDVGFQVSQRADFIEKVVSPETRSERAIVNLRDESLADERRFRRLHLILGDSNRCATANRLKLGTTGVVLDLIERGWLGTPPLLDNPVAAIKDVSRDLACQCKLELSNGERSSAIEIQRWYLEQARPYSRENGDRDTNEILDDWDIVLRDLEVDPDRVADRVDWVAKHRFLLRPQLEKAQTDWDEIVAWTGVLARIRAETGGDSLPKALTAAQYANHQLRINRSGLDWNAYDVQRSLYYSLRERDLRFHDIDPERGLFALLQARGLVEPGPGEEALEHAREHPPRGTRAGLRAQAIRWAHSRDETRATLDWGRVSLPGSPPVLLVDPLADTSSVLSERLAPSAPKKPIVDEEPAWDEMIRVVSIETLEGAKKRQGWLDRLKRLWHLNP